MPTTQALSDYEKERGKPMPSLNHSVIQKNLIVALAHYEPGYTVVSELTLALEGLPSNATPDVSVYGPMIIDYTHDKTRVSDPPLTAIEIISPSQSTQEVVDKIYTMLHAGVRSAWLVQPAMQTVTVYRPDEKPRTFSGNATVEDEALEGIEIGVGDVFRGASS